MKPRRLKPAFVDSRGVITDILEGVPINSITMITSKKGVVRGNHVHRRTIQYTYLLEGRLRYVSRKGKNGRVHRHVMRPGDLTWRLYPGLDGPIDHVRLWFDGTVVGPTTVADTIRLARELQGHRE